MKLLTFILLFWVSSIASADLTGTALIVDGDTITISGNKIRLSGIDTPEQNQTCRRAGISWRCGYEATETLRRWTYTKEVRCVGDTKDRYGRLIANCFVDGYNVNARQVLVRRMRLRDEVCPESSWVFFHLTSAFNAEVGDKVKSVRKAFSTACKRAGIADFHVHDLRHTFASWLVMNGIALFEVSKLLRHSSIQMTERYAHLEPDHLHHAVGNLGFSAHFQHSENLKQAVIGQNGVIT